MRDHEELYEPDSDIPDEIRAGWVSLADAGEHMEPVDDEFPMTATSLVGTIEVVGPNEVRFDLCFEQRYKMIDADGEVKEEVPYRPRPAVGYAVRTDERWHMRRIDISPETTNCAEGES